MTAALARSAPARRTAARAGSRSSKPKLRVLDQRAIRQRARRRNVLLILFIVLLVGLFAVAFAHAQLVAGQQDFDSLRTRMATAEAERARTERAVEEASAPEAIVARATELGMVRAFEPVYLVPVSPIAIDTDADVATDEIVPTIGAPLPEAISDLASAKVEATTTTTGNDTATDTESDDGSSGIALPAGQIIGSMAGTRAVTGGLGSG